MANVALCTGANIIYHVLVQFPVTVEPGEVVHVCTQGSINMQQDAGFPQVVDVASCILVSRAKLPSSWNMVAGSIWVDMAGVMGEMELGNARSTSVTKFVHHLSINRWGRHIFTEGGEFHFALVCWATHHSPAGRMMDVNKTQTMLNVGVCPAGRSFRTLMAEARLPVHSLPVAGSTHGASYIAVAEAQLKNAKNGAVVTVVAHAQVKWVPIPNINIAVGRFLARARVRWTCFVGVCPPNIEIICEYSQQNITCDGSPSVNVDAMSNSRITEDGTYFFYLGLYLASANAAKCPTLAFLPGNAGIKLHVADSSQ